MESTKRERAGFTLIELLTVIAIIAILAALLFPVFSRVRESVRQTTCFTNMHDIYRAMKLYKEDNNRYPASLLGFVQATDGTKNPDGSDKITGFYIGPSSGQPAKVTSLTYKPLFNGQKYLKDVGLFTCPDSKEKDQALPPVTATYPTSVGAFAGQTVTFTDIIRHNTGNDANWTGPVGPKDPIGQPAYFYAFDSYDIGPQLNPDGTPVPNSHELHYSLDWTGGSGSTDPQNQLKYGQNAPEDHTVLTWCTEHAANAGSDKVLVLMLSGKTIPVDAKLFVSKGPLNFAP